MISNRVLNAKRNIFYGITNRCIMLLMPFFIRTVIIKQLGADYLGLSSLFTSILQVLNLTEMGFSSAIIFSLYKPIAKGDVLVIRALMNMYRNVYKKIGILILIVGIIISIFLPHLIKGDCPKSINIYVIYWFYLINTAISYLLYAYKSALLIAHQRNDIEVNIITITNLLQYICQILVIIICKNFYLYVFFYIIFTIIGNLIRAYITTKKYPEYFCEGELSAELKMDIKKRVSGAFIQKFCATARNSFDSIFLSMFLGLSVITIYGNYYYILVAIHGVLLVIINGIDAGVGDSIARNSIKKNCYDMRKFTFMYAWLSGWSTVCLICLYQPFMEIWVGRKLMFPMSTVILFGIYFYILTIGDVRSSYITGAGLWWEGRYRAIVEAVVNLLLNYLLGKYFGVNGIIWATIISIVVINFLWGNEILYKYYMKGEEKKIYYKEHIVYFLVTLIVTVISYRLCMYIIVPGIKGIIIKAIIITSFSNTVFLFVYRKNDYWKESLKMVQNILRIKK